MVLHHSIHQNPECMAVITSLKSSDYYEAFRVLEKRFGAFRDTEKRKLQSVYANMRIQRGQSFRDFYGKIQDVVHKLNYHHGVTVDNDWLNHKISSNIPEAFRAYFYSIQHECLDPDTLVTRILELEDLTLQNSPVPASVNFTPETNHNQSRYRGRCGNCGNHRHHRRDCPLPKQHRNSKKNQKSKNWRSQNAKPEPPHNQNDKDRQNHNTKRDSNDGSSNRDQNHYIQNNQNFGNRKRNGSDLPSGRNTRANHVFLKNQGTSNLFYKMKHLKYSPYVCLPSQNTIPRKKEPQKKFCSEGSNPSSEIIHLAFNFVTTESVLPASNDCNMHELFRTRDFCYLSHINSLPVVIDSGASRSMFRDRTHFTDYTPIDNTFVYTANGKPLQVLGRGSIGFIPDCYHVPSLSRDLLSVPHIDATLGVKVTVKNGEIEISDATKRYPTLKGILNAQTMLYELPISSLIGENTRRNTPENTSHALLLLSKAEAVNRLHDIFHRDSKRLEQMIKDGVITWDVPYKPTNFNRLENDCDACRISKSTRKTFPGQIPAESQIGKLWYFDMWGPNETASIRGNTYIAGFIESVTKKVFLYFTSSKKCANFTRHFVTTEIPILRHRHGLKDFIIQSDTGEFVSREIEGILAENGGVLRHSSPYTPETQAVIERLWRTVTELATTMLLAAQLPEPYWEDATEYARLIYNRTIRNTSTPGVRKSPEEMYSMTKPTMKHYQPFGCKAYLHIPKSVRRKNHKGRAELGIFVGFDEQTYPGYKFYRPLYRDYVITAHCRFAKWIRRSLHDDAMQNNSSPSTASGNIDDFMYLCGTYHIDTEDGLLYETTRVEEKNFPNQGTLLVGYRRRILPNGTPEREDKDPIHIRDIEEMTNNTDEDILDRLPVLESPDTPDNDTHFPTPPHGSVPPGEQSEDEPSPLDRPLKAGRNPAQAQAKQSSSNAKPFGRGRHVQATIGHDARRTVPTTTAGKRAGDASTGPDAKRRRQPPERLAFLASSTLQRPERSDEDAYSEDYSQLYALSVANGDGLALLAAGIPPGTVDEFPEPQTHDEAMADSDANHWLQAEAEEMDSIRRLNMLSDPMPLPAGCKPVGLRWVYKKKRNAQGHVVRYRARLVAKGFQQTFGLDYFDTYSPVARLSSLRLLYALSVELNLQLAAMDVDAAFLNADLTEDIYIRAPPGQPELPKGYVYKLLKSLYGLKQSPKSWNDTLNTFLINECHLRRLQSESCLYVRTDGHSTKCLIVAIYVDDIVIAYNDKSMFQSFQSKLSSRFQCKNLGSLTRVLNMDIARTRDGGLFLSQESYVHTILERFHDHLPSDSNFTRLPFDPYLKLHKNGAIKGQHDHSSQYSAEEGAQPCSQDIPYRAVLGSLLWLAQGTRPDIAYAVTQCAKYAQDPRYAHWCALKKILRYLHGTSSLGIHYTKSRGQSIQLDIHGLPLPKGYLSSTNPNLATVQISAKVDADFANDLDDRRSITGYVFYLANAPITWQCKAETTVALSTMESEYMALAAATQESLWLRMMIEEMGSTVSTPVIIHEDNKACQMFSDHSGNFARTKHIDYRYHFVRERVHKGDIRVDYIQTDKQVADMFTKALNWPKFDEFRSKLLQDKNDLRL